MSNHMIIIERERALYGSAIKHSVELDGITIGTLKNGESISAHTTAGPHMLSFSRGKKQEKSISFAIGEDEQITKFQARINGAQKLEIFKNSSGGAGLVYTPHAKKKSGVPLAGKIVIAIFAVIVLAVAFGENSSEDSESPKETSGAAETAEPTNEEKAETQLEKATEKFQNGNYMEAISICGDIASDYPDTEIASNMGSYLAEQFSKYPHYSATELMSEYDANIVNADKEYTDTVMVVSGTVSSIAKTNGDKNLAVLLKSGTYFCGVQLNFKTSQTDAVAALKEGDKVSAVGKCTGKSGTQFIIFEGDNVMISNCYLIDG